MTNQEAFNKVWNHFVVNEAPYSYDGDICRYRDSDGNKCAFGLFITDEQYDPNMEGNPAEIVIEKYKLLGFDDLGFIRDLQDCHDYAVDDSLFKDELFTASVKQRLRELANTYKLTIPSNE